MTLRAHVMHILEWWRRLHPSAALEAIPEWREASRLESAARRRNDTRAIGRARQQKRAAVHAALGGR